MLRWLVGFSRSTERTGAAVRIRTPRSRAIGHFECLEARALLSALGHPRILNGDEIDERPGGIVNGIPTSDFAAVGKVGDRSSFYCTGTLIAERFVLTAAHCVDSMNSTSGRFAMAGTTYHSSRIFLHPNYNESRIGVDDSANDLAVMELSISITTVTPSPIFRGTPQVGDVLTLVGYGATGNAESGHDGSYGTKRMGTTPIDGLTARRILWTFDNNSESNTGPGDSGGPAYLRIDGTFHIAGVTSGGDRANAGLGDNSYDTRVDAYAGWIDSVVATSGPGPQPGDDDHADVVGPAATVITVAGDGSFAMFGSLETIGDRDVFQIELDTRTALSVDLGSSGNRLDTFLRIYDSLGNLLAQDDDSGPGTDSRLSRSLDAGLYYISAASYNDRGSGNYSLNGRFHSDDHGDTLFDATAMPLLNGSAAASGVVGHAGDVDVFQITASSNSTLSIQIATPSSNLDSIVTVFDQRGRQIALNDDTATGTDSQAFVRVKAGRTYYVQASGYHDSKGSYDVVVTTVPNQRRHRNRSESEPGSTGRSAAHDEALSGVVLVQHARSVDADEAESNESERRRSDRAAARYASNLSSSAVDHLLSLPH